MTEIPTFMCERAIEALKNIVRAVSKTQDTSESKESKELWKEYDNAVLILKDIDFWRKDDGKIRS